MKNFILLLCSFLTITLAGCNDNEEELPEPQAITKFSIFQASPDAPDMDVLVGSQRLSDQAFKYPTYTGSYNASPGSYRFRFNPVGAANSYIDSTLTLAENKSYSLFTVGRFQNLDLLVVQDSLKAPAAGKVGIRFLHLSPDAAPVNVVTTGANGATLFSNVGFKENTQVIEIAGGTHSFQVKRANGETVLVSLANYDLVAGQVYYFLLRGLETPPSGNTNTLSIQVIRKL